MDKQGFRAMLQALKLHEEQIKESMAIAERFESYINGSGRIPPAETAWSFSRLLIEEGNNTFDNYVALIRYCRFIKNNDMFVALMELVDGGEVGDNLYRMVEEKFGTGLRDEVFAGIGVAPYGLPTPDKPVTLQPVLERLLYGFGRPAGQPG